MDQLTAVAGDGEGYADLRPGRILVVDDEIVIRALLSETLKDDGHEVVLAEDGRPAIELLEQGRFDAVISDIYMPDVNGIEVLLAVKRLDPDCPVVMITGFPSPDTVTKLVNLGAADYISKPFDTNLIKLTVTKLVQMRRMRQAARGNAVQATNTIDTETGAYVRDLFVRLVEVEVGRSQWREHPCSVLTTKVHGPAGYDVAGSDESWSAAVESVRPLADAVQAGGRPGDIVGRTGVTELSVLLPETDSKEAAEMAERLNARVLGRLSVEVGTASLSSRIDDAAALLRAARDALRRVDYTPPPSEPESGILPASR